MNSIGNFNRNKRLQMMRSILLTGGAGFIGSNFIRYWKERYPQETIVVLDLLTYAGNPENIRGIDGVDLVQGDILDTPAVEYLMRERHVNTIVHFAAESHVDRSIVEPDSFISTNIVGTHSLLKASRRVWLAGMSERPHRFHHVSTDEVYGSLGPGDPPFGEATRYAPNSPYSASKAASDHLVRAYCQTYGLQATTSYCSNNYGPYQHPEKLIPLFLINCLEGRRLPIYGDGMNVRDWLHVHDHCQGIERILNAGRPGEAYNIGGGAELPNLMVIEAICDTVDQTFLARPELVARFPNAPAARGQPSASLKTFVDDRPGHDRRYAMNCSKACLELGYKPRRLFHEGLAQTLQWYLDNEAWWRPHL